MSKKNNNRSKRPLRVIPLGGLREIGKNMAVTVEPGIYLPDEFGVRIEDLSIITDFGIINTVKSPKELIIL